MDALALHRIHFAFTITYHYLFPQLTMGLALLIVVLKTMALRTGRRATTTSPPASGRRIFAVNFLLGVVTGIPMEFQFGTNWSEFSRRTGGVIGMPLAMEGIFSFFLESAFLGLFLFGEKRLSQVCALGRGVPGLLSARGSPASSSSSPTPGCSTRSPISCCPTACLRSAASGG